MDDVAIKQVDEVVYRLGLTGSKVVHLLPMIRFGREQESTHQICNKHEIPSLSPVPNYR